MKRIHAVLPQVEARMVLPNARLLELAREFQLPETLRVQIGDLPAALRAADLALASTGTVTLECAYFGVPAVALYKTSWITWQIARRIITVKYGAMPNLLADREIYPEFIQDDATPENIAKAALSILQDPSRGSKIQDDLVPVVRSLGTPGAARRAARAILETLEKRPGDATR
jgi:lipid-A-disaccharide synthase